MPSSDLNLLTLQSAVDQRNLPAICAIVAHHGPELYLQVKTPPNDDLLATMAVECKDDPTSYHFHARRYHHGFTAAYYVAIFASIADGYFRLISSSSKARSFLHIASRLPSELQFKIAKILAPQSAPIQNLHIRWSWDHILRMAGSKSFYQKIIAKLSCFPTC